MGIQILRDLRGLRVHVMHPPDAESSAMVEHLGRIGCIAMVVWPLPTQLPDNTDLVLLAIEHDSGELLRRLFGQQGRPQPTVIGIVGYENPSTLQVVLEIGAHAVIERPIRPFGLLTQLVIARSLWLRQQDDGQKVQKLARRLTNVRTVQRARLILMADQQLSEEQAYQTIRRRAMAKRVPIEEVAMVIINAHQAMLENS